MPTNKQSLTVRYILTAWLTEHGYDGLCRHDFDGLCRYECGCAIEDMPLCEGDCLNCVPGHKVPDPTGESRYLIVEGKPMTENKDAKAPKHTCDPCRFWQGYFCRKRNIGFITDPKLCKGFKPLATEVLKRRGKE